MLDANRATEKWETFEEMGQPRNQRGKNHLIFAEISSADFQGIFWVSLVDGFMDQLPPDKLYQLVYGLAQSLD